MKILCFMVSLFLSSGDDNLTRREVVRKKTAKYLLKAEKLYHLYLDSRERGVHGERWDVRMVIFSVLDNLFMIVNISLLYTYWTMLKLGTPSFLRANMAINS